MATEYLMSLGGWAFLPGLVTNWSQSIYYGVTIRAGEPHPQPGTPIWNKHRRNIFTLVIVGYLLFTIYSVDWSIRQAGDFYSLLGISHTADEKAIARQLRRQLAAAHPDKAPANRREEAEALFIQVKVAYDTLSDPVKRFAYERLGPEVLEWKGCKNIWEHVAQGAQNSVVTSISTLVVIFIAQAFGQMGYGKYWRYLILAALLVFELHTITRPHFPKVLTRLINPIFEQLPRAYNHPPYLPFQLIKLMRQTAFSAFVALNQLAPWWAPRAADETTTQHQLLSTIRKLLAMNQADSQRLLALEHMPFAGDHGAEGRMKERLVEWLVENEVRNDSTVSKAMKAAIERRNAEVEAEGNG